MKIGVIMGGVSSERDISLSTGRQILKYLNKDKYESIIPVVVDEKKEVVHKVKDIDFAFIALHGKFGEDGTIQGLLESLEIPYSGCGVLTSSICMNKDITKKILRSAGIKTAPWFVISKTDDIDYEKVSDLGYPVFIKPNCGGSSIATCYTRGKKEVKKAIKEALNFDDKVIVEKYIEGDEITSFMLGGEVFPILQIKSNQGNFFDYRSKYDDDGAIEKVAYFKPALQAAVDDVCKEIWKIFSCKGYCRIDMIIRHGVPYVLEVNTLPGMTNSSLILKSAAAKGMSFDNLLDQMIEYSL